jgi:hypothetical protein
MSLARAGSALSLAAVLAFTGVADAKVKVKILGWTTQPATDSPQVKNGGTIKQCLDVGDGQRSLYVIYKGRGISKGTKVAAAIWGGPPSGGPFAATEPSNAEAAKFSYKWPVGSKKSSVQRWGFSAAKGPFGPQNINGAWHAKVLVKGKVAKRGSVTVAC